MNKLAQVKRWLLMGLSAQTEAEKKFLYGTPLERPTNDEAIREAVALIEAVMLGNFDQFQEAWDRTYQKWSDVTCLLSCVLALREEKK